MTWQYSPPEAKKKWRVKLEKKRKKRRADKLWAAFFKSLKEENG